MTRLRTPSQPLARKMSERDDIEFDFFEESDTRETQEERPRRGPRPPVRPPTGLTPLLRLIGLISFAILIILLLVLWVNGCREDKRKDAYRHYVEKVADLRAAVAAAGPEPQRAADERGTKESDVESELSGLARQQEQIASAARGLNPPGRLRAEDAHMLDALDLRSNGLRGMTDAFRSTASSKNAGTAGAELAVQMQRLIASDVIWQDLFKEPTKSELAAAGRHGRQRPGLDLPREPRHRHHCVDEVALAAHPRRRGRRRHELLAARHRARLDEGAPERQGAVRRAA